MAEVVRAHCVAALSTDLMPTAGKDASAALAEARALLAEETNPGAVVFLTDGFESGDRPAVEAARKQGIEVLALAVGPSPGLAPVSDLVDVVGLTVDDRDVDRIARQIGASSGATTETERAERRKDFGLYLLYPIVALALFGFRRGFAVRRRMPCGARCASGRRTPV
ncbi:MAG: hypothetical protein P8R42_09915 [Candidatus Binatia bacterium]|nr:hypothetical protein [Candidatus Binatia bacterium]